MHQPKAIVIGSGVAGMACAIRLSIQGFDVHVFEKNNYPGGKLSLIEKDGFRFDAGPSLYTQPQNLEALFADAGEDIAEYFQCSSVSLTCRYFYENGKVINAFAKKELFEAELYQKLGEQKGSLQTYLNKSEQLYQSIGTVFLNNSLHKIKTWLQPAIFKSLLRLKLPYIFSTLYKYNSSQFQSAEAIQLFNRFATYNGSNPYQTPGIMSLIPHLELNQGTFYPKGGMISITNALYNLAKKKNVIFHFNSPVQRIIEHQNIVKGVVVHDENIMADVVVSNVDVYFTYKNLLQNAPKAKRLLRQERSCSGVIFYWGMNRKFPELDLHNIFFSKNYETEFTHIFKYKRLYADPTVYVNITSKMESEHAPEGKENWFVLVNAPANTSQNWEEEKVKLKQHIINKLSKLLHTDIADAIETEETLDPITIENRTGSYLGALYGTSSNGKMSAFFRHPNFTSATKGLYFCGGSVHPGGGIPLCFKSAEIVSTLIANDFIKGSHT